MIETGRGVIEIVIETEIAKGIGNGNGSEIGIARENANGNVSETGRRREIGSEKGSESEKRCGKAKGR